MSNYLEKYLKYKSKYQQLKIQKGGAKLGDHVYMLKTTKSDNYLGVIVGLNRSSNKFIVLKNANMSDFIYEILDPEHENKEWIVNNTNPPSFSVAYIKEFIIKMSNSMSGITWYNHEETNQSNASSIDMVARDMSDASSFEKPADESSVVEFQFDDAPVVRHQSPTYECPICLELLPSNMFHLVKSVADAETDCKICYSCLFDGLHSQFTNKEMPRCVFCNFSIHQTVFQDILAILEANFSSSLGESSKNNKVCTCGALPPSMFARAIAQNPENIKIHNIDCGFAIIKRMQNQVEDLLTQCVLSKHPFVACPGPDCKSVVEINVIENPMTGEPMKIRQSVQCLACSTIFCPKCGSSPYHFNSECESIETTRKEYSEWIVRGRQEFLEYRAQLDTRFQKQMQEYEADKERIELEKQRLVDIAREAAADETFKATNCKLCPHCTKIVLKNEGCDAMICGQNYHGGEQQNGCGQRFNWSSASPYRAEAVKPKQINFDREKPQQILHKWQLYDGNDLNCDACAGPIIGPKFTCINCPSLTICATCESMGPHSLSTMLNQQFYGSHKTNHMFKMEIPPSI